MYKIGDKVETKLGVGIIKERLGQDNYQVEFNRGVYDDTYNFHEYSLKPYLTAHDKLLALGCRFHEEGQKKKYNCPHSYDFKATIFIDGDYVDVYGLNLELARIMVQYLEELE